MENLINDIKNSVVFLGLSQDKIIGTGFLINHNGIYHLVSAKHVVEKNYRDLRVFLNSKQFNKTTSYSLNDIYKDGYSWISSTNQSVDIAILPFQRLPDYKVKFISDNLINNDLSQIHELIDVFYLSYQPGVNDLKRDGNVNPIIRKGVVSRINSDNTFFIDGAAFPGNSGSPVFLFPSPIKIENNKIIMGGSMNIQLLGVMGAYIPYKDVARSEQTGRPKVIFEENTGISLVYSTKSLIEIIRSDDFKKQLSIIQSRLPPTPRSVQPITNTVFQK